MGGLMLRKKSMVVMNKVGTQERETDAAGDDGGKGTVRLTLAVPRSLHTRLKLAAVRQERSIVSVVSGWIEEKTVAV